jgi:sec-independent protein translocase protein TatA
MLSHLASVGSLHPFAFFNLGGAEILVLLVIGLLLFGNRLPELARNLGKTVQQFRKEADALTEEIRQR